MEFDYIRLNLMSNESFGIVNKDKINKIENVRNSCQSNRPRSSCEILDFQNILTKKLFKTVKIH